MMRFKGIGNFGQGYMRESWGKEDGFYLFLLLFWAAALNGYKLGELEFFRHTEADRTLIAWSMAETGNFLVPKLLGSEILTKPPLYYWISAASISFFGTAAEWAARFPSYFFSVLLVLSQYVFLRLFGLGRLLSLSGAFFLSTSLSFLILGTVAEIDLIFAFFCSLALYAGGLSLRRKSLVWTFVGYFFSVLAFLTKGPPVVFFYGASITLLYLMLWRCARVSEQRDGAMSFSRFLSFNILGVLLFLLLITAWIVPLAQHVGWEVLSEQLRVEVFERIIEESSRGRGVLFYIEHLLAALTPWCLFLVLGVVNWLLNRSPRKETRSGFFLDDPVRFLSYFSLIVVVSGILMLTFAEGKSSRYIFPIHVFGINLSLWALLSLRGSIFERYLLMFGKFIGAISPFACVVAVLILRRLPGVSSFGLLLSAFVLTASLLFLYYCCSKKQLVAAVASLGLVMFAVRVGQAEVFVPYRNETRSIKALVHKVHEAIPEGEAVYTLEMFERWINYYLKFLGRESYRLTPKLAEEFSKERRDLYLLLSSEEEYWRIFELRLYDPSAELLAVFSGGKEMMLLVRANTQALPHIYLRKQFPTDPSVPFLKQFSELLAEKDPSLANSISLDRGF